MAHSVGDEVAQHLTQAERVGEHDGRGAVEGKGLATAPELGHHGPRLLVHGHADEVEAKAADVRASGDQEIVDHAVEISRLIHDDPGELAGEGHVVEPGGLDGTGRGVDAGQRCAQLVGDVAEQPILGAAQLPLLLECFGEGDASPTAPRQQQPPHNRGSRDAESHQEAGRRGQTPDLRTGYGDGRGGFVALSGDLRHQVVQGRSDLLHGEVGGTEGIPGFGPLEERCGGLLDRGGRNRECGAQQLQPGLELEEQVSGVGHHGRHGCGVRRVGKEDLAQRGAHRGKGPESRLGLLLSGGGLGDLAHSVGVGVHDGERGQEPDDRDQRSAGDTAEVKPRTVSAVPHGLVTSALRE